MFFKIGVLKNFAIFRGKRLCWSLFFNKTYPMAASEKSLNFSEKHEWHNRFIFLINMTEQDIMLIDIKSS